MIINGEHVIEHVIEKSKFIVYLKEVHSLEEALEYLNSLKKKHNDANHNCSAFIIGKDMHIKRSSDDGEPSNTAGNPMLNVLEKNGIYNTICVITRYFGGIKLGTGGLIRAYSSCTSLGIKNAKFYKEVPYNLISIKTSFDNIGKIEQYLRDNFSIEDTIYTNNVEYQILIPNIDDIETINDRLNGKCEISNLGIKISKEFIKP